MNCFLLLLILIFVFIIVNDCRTEKLTSRPSPEQAKKMSNEILRNKDLFTNHRHTAKTVGQRLPYVDVVLYEDLRNLARNEQFTDRNIYNTILH